MCFCEKFYDFFQVSLTLLSLLAIYAYVAFVTSAETFHETLTRACQSRLLFRIFLADAPDYSWDH
jgi:hypothetical protein